LRSDLFVGEPHDGCYLGRPPVRLVLEGYRRWLTALESGSVMPWEPVS
jgi:hypothetical protein